MLHTQLSTLHCIGYASGWGANDRACAKGPESLYRLDLVPRLTTHKLQVKWHGALHPAKVPGNEKENLDTIVDLSQRLSHAVEAAIIHDGLFLVLGGDHSSAIGTWSGAAKAKRKNRVGLIWIDAHMDAHTFDTSPSGAIHGMPLACLLGKGEHALTNIGYDGPKLLPEDIVLIGVRSYESGEADLLRQLGVKVYYMDDIERRGLATVMTETRQILQRQVDFFGISLDLDALDPSDAPGVGSPEPNGIPIGDLLNTLTPFNGESRFLGLEIAEYNPDKDHNFQTAANIFRIAQTAFS